MSVTEGSTAAVGVDGLVTVISGTTLTDVLPAFAVGQVAGDLSGNQVRGDDEVVGIEHVHFLGLHAGHGISLTASLFGGADLEVRIGSFHAGATDTHDLDGLMLQVLADIGDHLSGADNAGSSAVALMLDALSAQEVAQTGVIGRTQILDIAVKALLLGDLLEGGALQSQLALGSVAAVVDDHPVQSVVHLLGSNAAGADIIFSGIVVDQFHGSHQAAAVNTVIQPCGGLQELLHGDLLTLIGMLGGIYCIVGINLGTLLGFGAVGLLACEALGVEYAPKSAESVIERI